MAKRKESKDINYYQLLDIKKKAFVDAWIATFGNITKAAELCKMHRTTYHLWMNSDAVFKKAIESEDVGERFLDFLEEKLKDKIIGNDTTALIFALKCKGKKRGYVERTESKEVGDRTVNVNFSDDVKQWL